MFERDLDLANNQHQLARLLFHYLDVDKNRIRIGRRPASVFSLKASTSDSLEFFHVHEREFRIAYLTNGKLDCVVECEFCDRSFSRYFKLHKLDEYHEDVKQKMLGVFSKKREFYLEVVKYNENESLENALIGIVMNFMRVIDGVR